MKKFVDNSLQGAYLNDAVVIALRDFLINKNKLWYGLISFSNTHDTSVLERPRFTRIF